MTNARILGLSLLVSTLALTGCNSQKPVDAAKDGIKKVAKNGDQDDHGDHGDGPHGGTIIECGKIHAEFTVEHGKKQATVYVLDGNVKKNEPIAAEKLLLSIKSPQFQVELKAAPQDGDPKGKSSRFVATHDNFGKEQEFEGTVSGEIEGKPYLGDFKEKPDHKDGDKHSKHSGMPAGVGGTPKEQELFLTPGGIYTAADIKANGETVPSIKYAGISWPHDDAKPGDKICPVTANKTDEKCTWVVNGKTYEFCCTPCLDKFVKWAKQEPAKVKEPGAYVQK